MPGVKTAIMHVSRSKLLAQLNAAYSDSPSEEEKAPRRFVWNWLNKAHDFKEMTWRHLNFFGSSTFRMELAKLSGGKSAPLNWSRTHAKQRHFRPWPWSHRTLETGGTTIGYQ